MVRGMASPSPSARTEMEDSVRKGTATVPAMAGLRLPGGGRLAYFQSSAPAVVIWLAMRRSGGGAAGGVGVDGRSGAGAADAVVRAGGWRWARGVVGVQMALISDRQPCGGDGRRGPESLSGCCAVYRAVVRVGGGCQAWSCQPFTCKHHSHQSTPLPSKHPIHSKACTCTFQTAIQVAVYVHRPIMSRPHKTPQMHAAAAQVRWSASSHAASQTHSACAPPYTRLPLLHEQQVHRKVRQDHESARKNTQPNAVLPQRHDVEPKRAQDG